MKKKLFIIAHTTECIELTIEKFYDPKEATACISNLLQSTGYRKAEHYESPQIYLAGYYEYVMSEMDNMSEIDITMEVLDIEDNLKQLSTYELSQALRDRGTAFILWQADDVMAAASDLFKEREIYRLINEKEAKDILEGIHFKGDCSYGITWETIYSEIRNFLSNESI